MKWLKWLSNGKPPKRMLARKLAQELEGVTGRDSYEICQP